MPLFGSQKNRNSRLFQEVFATFARRVDMQSWPDVRKNLTLCMYMGASGAAQSIVEGCDPVRDLWKGGSKQQAAYMTSLYGLPMIPRYFWLSGIAKRIDAAELNEQMLEAARGFVGWADTPAVSPRMIPDYMKLTAQYFRNQELYERDGKPHGPDIEYEYLLGKSIQVCGGTSNFRCSRVTFPVESVSDFLSQGGVLESSDPVVTLSVFGTVNIAAGAMMRALEQFEELTKTGE